MDPSNPFWGITLAGQIEEFEALIERVDQGLEALQERASDCADNGDEASADVYDQLQECRDVAVYDLKAVVEKVTEVVE